MRISLLSDLSICNIVLCRLFMYFIWFGKDWICRRFNFFVMFLILCMRVRIVEYFVFMACSLWLVARFNSYVVADVFDGDVPNLGELGVWLMSGEWMDPFVVV